jgi:hypothetical protein
MIEKDELAGLRYRRAKPEGAGVFRPLKQATEFPALAAGIFADMKKTRG